MLFKIAINNVRKSLKDYTIYFLTLTFAVCIFYSFNSIDSQTVMADMNKGQTEYVKTMEKIISTLSIVVSVILGGLIIYATNFLINKRKKEFGIYMVLGMAKRKMSRILFFETLFIGIISLFTGLLAGMLFSQILSIFTARLFAIKMSQYSFIISTSAILKTFLYFGIMYLLVMIFNVIIVSRYKLIDLLYADRKSEKVKVRNAYLSSFILAVSCAALGYAYYLVNESGLNFNDNGFKLSIAFGIMGTLLFFYGIASVVLFILQKNKNLYLRDLNVFSTRQISSKFNTNFISMTVICLMLFITIGILSTGISIKNSLEGTLKNQTPFDASLTLIKLKEDNITISEALKKLGYNLENNTDYVALNEYTYNMSTRDLLSKYAATSDEKQVLNLKIFDSTSMYSISDINKLKELKGEDRINLKDDEIIIASNYEPLSDILNKFLKGEDSIKIGDKKYKIKQKQVFKEAISTSPTSDVLFSLIVPDSLLDEVQESGTTIDLNFKEGSKEKAKSDLTLLLNNFRYDEGSTKNMNFKIFGQTREMAYDDSRGLSAIVLFIAVYLGIVFLLASAAVLALQQLSQCNDSVERYRALRKVGATKGMINRSILKQVLTFFLMPLALAIVHSYVGITVVNNYLIALGSGSLIKSIMAAALIMVMVYGGYLYSTYIAYKNIINTL